ncbi:helix-loop-helix protein delilah-like [Procambarus clarkii]|uniref:helix-loop-helix protein delilah-like n=1 Tax=Procambarus clarkii TaxID=6728 RepID=UPI001E67529F|nr:helix-loop-helix protein delilah-like [Procambarus clarkii]
MERLEDQGCYSPSTDTNNNTNSSSNATGNTHAEEKYALRPRTIIKRLQQERTRQEVPKRPAKSKSRPAPLSKYRRKTANARERHRMREINNAFESLRKVLPDTVEVHAASATVTKIMTLRLAVEYIRALSDVLEDDSDQDFSSFESSLHNSIQNSLHSCLQHSFAPSLQQHVLQKTMSSSESPMTFQYEHSTTSFIEQGAPQLPQFVGHYTLSDPMSVSSSPSTLRGSVSSTSDLEELLSDDSGLLEDSLDVFHDIPTLTVADPFDILLSAEKDTLVFTTELCN